eukprot:COSAG05_NODE_17060_length_332_cov_1.772532_1_plen_40_part_01
MQRAQHRHQPTAATKKHACSDLEVGCSPTAAVDVRRTSEY